MNIIFFTCIFVIEQVYQNKLSTKATAPACAHWSRRGPCAQVSPQPRRGSCARSAPTTALRRREAAPAPPARRHRQRRNTAVGLGCPRAPPRRWCSARAGEGAGEYREGPWRNPCHWRGGRPGLSGQGREDGERGSPSPGEGRRWGRLRGRYPAG